MDDGQLQRIRRVGAATFVLAVGAVIWGLVQSHWLIWLIALSFACAAFALLGEYRKAKSVAMRRSTGFDEDDGR